MKTKTLNILQISTYEQGGGAERVAWLLFDAYRTRGLGSQLAVGFKQSNDPDVIELRGPRRPFPWAHMAWVVHGRLSPLQKLPGVESIRRLCRILAIGTSELMRQLGRENFHHPTSHRLVRQLAASADIVHGHNLHGDYFDLRLLVELSHKKPLVLTLHDEWLLTGHCACTLGCSYWERGCGNCPDLTIYPEIYRDATHWNWKRKQRIYARSRLYIATPSRWLMERVQRSMLQPVETRVIPNGIDLSLYHPADKYRSRITLALPTDAIVLLFAATGLKNRFKDYPTLEAAVRTFAAGYTGAQQVIFVALGAEEKRRYTIGQVTVYALPFIKDPATVAQYFQAADVYLHAAHADNFPNVVLEALACGTPVIATAVGGIPEQIADGVTGFLTPPGDSQAMAERLHFLVSNAALRARMSTQAAIVARQRFDHNRQVQDYLNWYQEILMNDDVR
ncbi:MAG TPA: glycosyltransferase [Anaerolineae bacterium]|nr:glycosyltransferase [Anaerolineae bacterium]HQI83596.1 glycosyltransferase [Anaerolineae bacterium]